MDDAPVGECAGLRVFAGCSRVAAQLLVASRARTINSTQSTECSLLAASAMEPLSDG